MPIWLVRTVVTSPTVRIMSSYDQLTVQGKLSFVSFNCHSFNNGLSYLPVLLDSCDVILLQEHWLSVSELYR